MFLNQLLNAIIQVVLFSIIPFIWWLVTARKKENFFQWLGVKKPECESKKNLIITMAIIFAICYFTGEFAIWLRGDVAAADSAYKGMGLAALPSVLVYSFIQTGLSEEILFRGFLLKRLTAKFGFTIANIIQALIFGAIHLTMVWDKLELLQVLLL